MVLAQIFREEGREEGYAQGYAESVGIEPAEARKILRKEVIDDGFKRDFAKGYAVGLKRGRAEAYEERQAIADLQERVKRLEAAKGKSQE